MSLTSNAIRFTATSNPEEVTAILTKPDNAFSILVLAHGAGAGMRHPFMEKVAHFLADERIAVFRFNFPYIEKQKKYPDPPAIAMKTVQSAVTAAQNYSKGLPLFAGGKSFGGRMTSQAAATGMLEAVKGIVFWGFPLHAPGKPSKERAVHLYEVKLPMLFLQGTHDTLADISLMRELGNQLGSKATLHEVEGGDHSFHVPKSGGKDDIVLKELCRTVRDWMKLNLD
ncbi:MAG TPA: alpha/beta family hydrolase [Chitinophagales bacterium]|nr:alpha/beta family hydrolase [Chitinophagales bacterium]